VADALIDICTEPDGDTDAFAALGPLHTLPGISTWSTGHDRHTVVDGARTVGSSSGTRPSR